MIGIRCSGADDQLVIRTYLVLCTVCKYLVKIVAETHWMRLQLFILFNLFSKRDSP